MHSEIIICTQNKDEIKQTKRILLHIEYKFWKLICDLLCDLKPHSERYQLLLKTNWYFCLWNKTMLIWIVTTSSKLDPSDQITDSDSVLNHAVTCYRLFILWRPVKMYSGFTFIDWIRKFRISSLNSNNKKNWFIYFYPSHVFANNVKICIWKYQNETAIYFYAKF